MICFGSDVSNAFGNAPPPKQGFFIRPDTAFKEWWISKGREPIPDGYVIPVLAAMQGHPESPRLWEKHIDKILRVHLKFTPTVHEPCLYCGYAMVKESSSNAKSMISSLQPATMKQPTKYGTASMNIYACQ
jgi:hypothetical protein